MDQQVMKWVVHVIVRGSVSRPPYEGDMTVWAANPHEAADKAKRELLRGTFRGVWPDSIEVAGCWTDLSARPH